MIKNKIQFAVATKKPSVSIIAQTKQVHQDSTDFNEQRESATLPHKPVDQTLQHQKRRTNQVNHLLQK